MSPSPATPHSRHPQHTAAGGGAAFDLLTVGDTALCAPAVIAAQVSVSEWEGSRSVERWSSTLPTDPLHTIVLDSTPKVQTCMAVKVHIVGKLMEKVFNLVVRMPNFAVILLIIVGTRNDKVPIDLRKFFLTKIYL